MVSNSNEHNDSGIQIQLHHGRFLQAKTLTDSDLSSLLRLHSRMTPLGVLVHPHSDASCSNADSWIHLPTIIIINRIQAKSAKIDLNQSGFKVVRTAHYN